MPGSWIQADVNLAEHPKTYALADRLGITNAHAVGLMVCLWGWAYRSAPDGLLTGFPARAIATAAGWHKIGPKTSAAFVETLIECRWIDREADGLLHIHDWDEHEGLVKDYMAQRKEKDRQRVKRYREKKSRKQSDDAAGNDENCNVTVTPMSRCIPIPVPVPIPDQYPISAAIDHQVPGSSAGESDELRGVLEVYRQKIRSIRSDEEKVLERLCGKYGARLVMDAIDEAEGKGRSANYVAKILERWSEDSNLSGETVQPKPSCASYNLDEYEAKTMSVPGYEGEHS